jgi:predicted permease
VLVVAEVGLAFMLLIGAGLLVRGFALLTESSLGFQPEKVLGLEVFTSRLKYPQKEPEKLRAFIDRSIENLRAVPGVESAGATNFLPLTGFWGSQNFAIEGRPTPEKGREPEADNRMATPDYFRSMGIPLVRGRVFTAADGPDAPHVAIIGASFAARYWKDEDPVGRRLNLGDAEHPDWFEIVGVVGTVHSFGLEEKAHDDLYRPFAQVWFPLISFTVKTSADPAQITAAAKAAIWKLDPTQPFYKVIAMEDLSAESVALRRVSTLLLAAFSAIALILAAVGIYGVLSYSVAQRTHEIGIRSALGASPGNILRLVLGEGARIAAAGTGLGLAAALALSQLLGSLLYGVSARDPLTFAAVAALSSAVALAACYVPARRATRVDPLVALRHE